MPSLTSLRGLAAFWVVLYHYGVQCFPNLDAASHSQLIHKGYLAVDMFFMLSGFVMTHVYHRAFCDSVTRHYRGFMVARIARLYPLHILVLLLFVATVLATQFMHGRSAWSFPEMPLHGPQSAVALVANLFMLQGLNAGQLSWNYPAWSISVEFMAYLAFPFALPLVWRAPKAAKIALMVCLFGALAVLAFVRKGDFDQWDGPIVLLRCFPEFFLGTLLYCAFRGVARDSWLKRDVAAFGLVAVTVICLHVGAPDLLATALFAAVILVAVVNDGAFARAINVKPLVWLGDISYSLYLIHGLVQLVADKSLDALGFQPDHADVPVSYSLAAAIVMIGICLLAATITYSGVEIGWRRYLRDLLAPRRTGRLLGPPRLARVAVRRDQRGISTQ